MPEFQDFSRGDITAFLKQCSDPRRRGREKVLELLLAPEGADLPGYYARLFEHLANMGVPAGIFPPELLKVFVELIAFSEESPRDAGLGRLFHSAAAKMHRGLPPWLFQKRYPIGPFLDCMAGRPARCPRGGAGFCNRWRILRNFLTRPGITPVSGPSTEITLADLGPLFEPRARRSGSAWRMRAKHLVRARPAPAPTAADAWAGKRQAGKSASGPSAAGTFQSRSFSFSKMYWGGLRTGPLAFWDRLADAQARELVEIRRLARRVSRDTGRVVLSWHNASLAAAGGWGFEDLSGQFPSLSVYNDFARSVRQSAGEIRRGLDERAAAGLFEMRAKRIYAPKAAQALERLRSLREMGRVSGSDWLEMSRRAGVLLDPAEVEQIDSGRKTEWSGTLAPHQRVGLDMVLAWYDHSKKTWAEGLCLLLALAMRGREAIESGLAPSFVLPWIDKFFISSRRRADQGYLERLFGLLAGRIEAPLVLFWEDTAHARLPSFGLCLEEMSARGLPFRGIGIFDPQGSKRSDAEAIILREYPKSLLFALRPISDAHYSGPPRPVFDPPSPGFPLDYDSSWKDNLVFIYTGTRVFPLLSVQTDMESIPSWISNGRERYPFGAWFRRLLRARAGLDPDDPADPTDFAYASWANLL